MQAQSKNVETLIVSNGLSNIRFCYAWILGEREVNDM